MLELIASLPWVELFLAFGVLMFIVVVAKQNGPDVPEMDGRVVHRPQDVATDDLPPPHWSERRKRRAA